MSPFLASQARGRQEEPEGGWQSQPGRRGLRERVRAREREGGKRGAAGRREGARTRRRPPWLRGDPEETGGQGKDRSPAAGCEGGGGAQDPVAGTRLRPEGRGLRAAGGWSPGPQRIPTRLCVVAGRPGAEPSRDHRWIAGHRAQRTVLRQVGAAAGIPRVGNLGEPRSAVLRSVESSLAGSPAPVPAAVVSAGQAPGLGRGEAVSLGSSWQGIAKTPTPLGYGKEGQDQKDQNPSPNSGSIQKEAKLAICRKKLLVAMGDARCHLCDRSWGGGMPLTPLLWSWRRDLGEQRCRQELASWCLSH